TQPLRELDHARDALFRRPVYLKTEEEIDHGFAHAGLRNILLHRAVTLVALDLTQMIADEFIVLEHGLPVAADIFAGHGFSLFRVAIAEPPARQHRRRRLCLVHIAIDAPIVHHLLVDGVPRLLRDDEEADAQARHDFRRLRRHRRSIGTSLETLERTRADL